MSSLKRGAGNGARCGSERWARVNTTLSWPGSTRPSRLGMQCPPYRDHRVSRYARPSDDRENSRTSDQDPRHEHQHAASHDLEGRLKKWRVHEAVANVGDGGKLDGDHDYGDGCRGPELRNEIRQRVAQAAERGHQAADRPADPRRAAAGE